MRGILGTVWGVSIASALVGAIIITGFGIYLKVPGTIILFAAANLSVCLVTLILFAMALSVIFRSRGTATDVGATLEREIESPQGQVELKQMGFVSLLTVAIVRELYETFTRREEPLWFWEFLGVAERHSERRDLGAFNRYLEWALLIGAGGVAFVITLLLGYVGYAVGASLYGFSSRSSLAGFLCGGFSCLIGGVVTLALALFAASVIRRVSILYALRAEEAKAK